MPETSITCTYTLVTCGAGRVYLQATWGQLSSGTCVRPYNNNNKCFDLRERRERQGAPAPHTRTRGTEQARTLAFRPPLTQVFSVAPSLLTQIAPRGEVKASTPRGEGVDRPSKL